MKYSKLLISCISTAILLLSFYPLNAQDLATKDRYKSVYIDPEGVMRWTLSDEEIKGFGVNYTLPFAHAYRAALKMNIDLNKAIDQDVYHFSRLGFDLYRIHVWDTEISDTLGNLLQNEHLKAFDYLISKLRERNINYIITPIAFWGNGWPEKDQVTPGFSHKYGKGACLTNPDAIRAQENYLTQFMQHVNPYTGTSYWQDPNLLAVEVSNEPHHRGNPDHVESYVAKMINAVKRSGYRNPVLYNFSHGINYVERYIAAGAEGGTFQWYPSGLGYQRELPGNFLPNVDEYKTPFDSLLKANGMAKIVYEFDAADINKSYMYPAMAISFRSAGIQLATHFAYDPTFMAPFNTEYNSHFMNLAYTPHKALALMISAKMFHEVPLYAEFCEYPYYLSFLDFLIDPFQDMAMYDAGESYIYTNSTEKPSWEASKLRHIAGHGSSPYVKYDGTGAYFLDKIEEGIWRLEVMPDVLQLADPFGRNSLDRKLAIVQWNTRKMTVKIEDLGPNFHIKGINKNNVLELQASEGGIDIYPGTYLLTTKKNDNTHTPEKLNNFGLNEFFAPPDNLDKSYLIHESPGQVAEGEDLSLEAKVISPEKISSVEIWVSAGRRNKVIPMSRKHGFSYRATLPGELIKEGYIHYHILIKTADKIITYPGEIEGTPLDWDFDYTKSFEIPVLKTQIKYVLFNPHVDWRKLRFRYWPDEIGLKPQDNDGKDILRLKIKQLHKADGENPNGPIIEDYSIRHFIDDLTGDSLFLNDKSSLHIELAGSIENPAFLQVALIDDMGVSYGTAVNIKNELSELIIPFEDLKMVLTVIMPRPYPSFLPYYFDHKMEHEFDLKRIRGIQIAIKKQERDVQSTGPYVLDLGKIWVE